MMPTQLISTVVPVFNEEGNLFLFYDAWAETIANIQGVQHELLFVDDGSTDGSFDVIKRLAMKDKRIKCLRLSRNFGSHAALTAGLQHASGDAAIMISVDLQDPPAIIADFVDRWLEGYHVVWGVRQSRDDPWMKKTLASLFYSLLRKVAFPNYPPQGMDCGLIDRRVLNVFNSFKDTDRIVPTLLVWAGFRQIQVPYHRYARYSGESKWSVTKRFKAAIDIIVSFSHLPIRAISYLGIVISLLSFAYASFLIAGRIAFGLGGAGWSSLMVAVLFLGGVQLITLGVIGEYIWRISQQVRARPLYAIMEAVGLAEEKLERVTE